MSIATEIIRLQNAKSALKTSIENKGVTVPSATKLDGYASLVDQITGGAGSYSVTLKSMLPTGTETITYTGTESGTVNIVDGEGSVVLPTGNYTFSSTTTIWVSGSVAVNANITVNCWFGTPVYWYGNECVSITGGWSKFSTGGALTKANNDMTIISGSAGSYCYAGTANQISLSNFSRIIASWSRDGGGSRNGQFGTSTTTTTSAGWTQVETKAGIFTQTTDYIELLDFTSAYARISDNGVIATGAGTTIYAMWFE